MSEPGDSDRISPLTPPATLGDWFLVEGHWHHVAYLFEGGLPELYVDGKPAQSRSDSVIFDRVLSLSEIERLYRAGIASEEQSSTTAAYAETVRELGGKPVALGGSKIDKPSR